MLTVKIRPYYCLQNRLWVDYATSINSMKLSLIIPVFNEAPHLNEFLKLIDQTRSSIEIELIIVDDFSNDGSDSILTNFIFTAPHLLLKHTKNCGKGAAMRTGINAATGDIIGIQDADFEYDPSQIEKLIAPIIEEKADIVYGARFSEGRVPNQPLRHYFANRTLTWLSNRFSGLKLNDMETCYKFMRTEVLKKLELRSRRFGIEPEITAKIAKLNHRIIEIPISYRPRSYATGKKINWLDGLAAIWHILRFNLRE